MSFEIQNFHFAFPGHSPMFFTVENTVLGPKNVQNDEIVSIELTVSNP